MKTHWMMTTAAIAILTSTGLAAAQGMNDHGAKSPGAMEKSAPTAQPRAQNAQPHQGDHAQAPQNGAQRKGQTTGQAPQAESAAPSRPQQRDRNAQQDKPGASAQTPDKQQRPRAAAEQKQENGAKGRAETTGRGDAAAASLTNEQRTKIRQVVVSKKIPQVAKVNFTVSVGAKIPRTVQFHPIPTEIVEIYPGWRGYQVILVGSELVIVDPATFVIVAVVVV